MYEALVHTNPSVMLDADTWEAGLARGLWAFRPCPDPESCVLTAGCPSHGHSWITTTGRLAARIYEALHQRDE
jgi:hypothetical protein